MNNRFDGIQSATGLSQRIDSLNLSPQEALQIQQSIISLQNKKVSGLIRRGKVHKLSGKNNIYIYKVNKAIRIMFSVCQEKEQNGIIIYDIIKRNQAENTKIKVQLGRGMNTVR